MTGRTSILETIVRGRRRSVQQQQAAIPLEAMREQALLQPVVGGFAKALRHAATPIAVIAELKRASPSAGLLRQDFPVRELSQELSEAGAAALSVVTEPDHFRGDDRFLAAARQGAVQHPLLRKDFLVDPWQVWESRLLGADAVLLIAGLLPASVLAVMLECVAEAGLEALVETKNEAEINGAVAAGAAVVGLNARDLEDFSVDLERAERLAARLPAGVLGVAESGVCGGGDLERLSRAGFQAALVGTALMRDQHPGARLSRWLASVSGESD